MVGVNKYKERYVYTGELKKGTNDRDGIGICIFDTGSTIVYLLIFNCIYEGHWTNDKQNGQGRCIAKIWLN